MKKLLLLTLIFIGQLLLSNHAYAGSWTPKFQQPELRLYSSYLLVKNVHGTNDANSPCGRSDYLILYKSVDRFDDVYATLLAAKIANKEVQIYMAGCDGNAPNDRPRISHVVVY